MFYYTYSLLTSPGVMMHELSHLFFCVMARVKVWKVRLFRFGNPAGYVVHDEPKSFIQSFLITFGPLIINSSITIFLFSQFKEPYYNWQSLVSLWLGFAIGMHAIPSTGDAKSLFQAANHRFWRNPFVLLGYPFVLILYILNLFKRLHIDFVFVGLLFWLGKVYLKG